MDDTGYPVSTKTLKRLWQYPFVEAPSIKLEYSEETAKSLLELSYVLLVRNRQINNTAQTIIDLDPPGFNISINLDTDIMYQRVNVAWFLYSSRMNLAIVVFTGTYNNTLTAVDLNYFQVEASNINHYKPDMKLHGGMHTLYTNIQKDLHSYIRKYVNIETIVLTTGASLGGAMSGIAALDLYELKLTDYVLPLLKNIMHYSFASPRVFNVPAGDVYHEQTIPSHRIVNISDVVCDTPLAVMRGQFFVHIGQLQHFDKNYGEIGLNHVYSYLLKYGIVPISEQ